MGASVAALLLAVDGRLHTERPPEASRSVSEALCMEVAREVSIQYSEGLMEASRARSVIIRCFEQFEKE